MTDLWVCLWTCERELKESLALPRWVGATWGVIWEIGEDPVLAAELVGEGGDYGETPKY